MTIQPSKYDGISIRSEVFTLVNKGRFLFFTAQHSLVGQDLLRIEALQSHSDTPHSVRLLWTSNQPDAETEYR
jgi:hypothetical protein